MPLEAAFAIPGALETRTGGYIYDRRVLEGLTASGLPVRHVPLLVSWPDPTPEAEADLVQQLGALPSDMPLIMDGLVLGAMDTALLARQTRPVIAMLHHPLGLETGLSPARVAFLLAREQANLRHVAHIVVSSQHTREILIDQFDVPAQQLSVALPGFDRPAGGAAVEKLHPPLILSVGIMCQRKGHDVLLAALGRIRGLDWQAVIAGRAQDAAVYQALIAQRAALGLEGRVRFVGELEADALSALYHQASLFALATRYEGYGMVLSEAQLHGLPVVSCAVGAVPQTVAGGGAILTAPDDADAFAGALAQVLQDRDLQARMGQDSLACTAALPTWQDTVAIMRAVIERVAG